jgi:predicted HTH transcriptional regulator
MEGDSLVLTIYRSKAAVLTGLDAKVRDGLGGDLKAALEFISGQQVVSSRDLMERLEFDERKAQRVLKKLKEAGLISRQGRGPSTTYNLVQP